MILKDLINNHPWDEIKPRLLELYPNEDKNINGYEHTYRVELAKEPIFKKPTLFISIAYIDNVPEEENTYHDVNGISEEDSKKEDAWVQGYAIEYCLFDEWLGFGISEKLLAKYSEIDIICHCLWEMTFVGFDTEEKQAAIDKLEQAIKEVDEAIENKDYSKLKELKWDEEEEII